MKLAFNAGPQPVEEREIYAQDADEKSEKCPDDHQGKHAYCQIHQLQWHFFRQ